MLTQAPCHQIQFIHSLILLLRLLAPPPRHLHLKACDTSPYPKTSTHSFCLILKLHATAHAAMHLHMLPSQRKWTHSTSDTPHAPMGSHPFCPTCSRAQLLCACTHHTLTRPSLSTCCNFDASPAPPKHVLFTLPLKSTLASFSYNSLRQRCDLWLQTWSSTMDRDASDSDMSQVSTHCQHPSSTHLSFSSNSLPLRIATCH